MSKDDRRQYLDSLKGVQRLFYFWYYYKWHVLGAVFLLTAGISLYLAASRTDLGALNVVVTDYYGEGIDTALLTERYAAAGGSRAVEYDVTMALDTPEELRITLVNQQKLTAMNSAGHLDVFLAPEAVFEQYAPRGLFYSLDSLLPEEAIDALLARDKVVSGRLDSAIAPGGITGHEDGTVLAGLRLSESKLAREAGIEVENLCAGIPASSVRKEDAALFLQALLAPYRQNT